MSEGGITTKIAKLLGIEEDKVSDRIADLDLDQLFDTMDAVVSRDADRVKTILGLASESGPETETENDENDNTPLDSDDDDEEGINPLFSKDAPEHNVETDDESAPEDDHGLDEADLEEETPFEANMGEKVSVDGKNGTLKVKRGPGDTVGVQIDGELTMVDKNKIRRPVAEGVMGMTGMGDLSRMQQLAGIQMTLSPEQGEYAVPAAPVKTPRSNGAVDDNPDPVMSSLLLSCAAIEASIPDLRVRDARVLRQRINNMLTKLNESATRKRQKL